MDRDYLEQKLMEIPKDVLEGTVQLLKKSVPEKLKNLLKEIYKKDPDNWMIPYHFGFGMSIRNVIREGGFPDKKLPDGNWDDYYVQVLEIAIGVREMPF